MSNIIYVPTNPCNRRQWNAEEIETLNKMLLENKTTHEIALLLKRSLISVESKIWRLSNVDTEKKLTVLTPNDTY